MLRVPAARYAAADVAVSGANRALAAALRVSEVPTFHVYLGMGLAKAVRAARQSPAAAVEKLCAALEELAPGVTRRCAAEDQGGSRQRCDAMAAQGAGAAGARDAGGGGGGSGAVGASAAAAAALGAVMLPAATAARKGGSGGASTQRASEARVSAAPAGIASSGDSSSGAGSAGGGGGGGSASAWDPPVGKAAKPGAKRRVPGAKRAAVYWPRMPCLRCGCPWWLGEDWDAVCARCGWDCEADGYDDDSNPLPQYQKRYDEITAELRAGRTPAWSAGTGAEAPQA